MKLTQDVVQRCHHLNYPALPKAVVDRVKYLLLDYIGVAARGSPDRRLVHVDHLVDVLEAREALEGARRLLRAVEAIRRRHHVLE